jgi:hypothetical protein
MTAVESRYFLRINGHPPIREGIVKRYAEHINARAPEDIVSSSAIGYLRVAHHGAIIFLLAS